MSKPEMNFDMTRLLDPENDGDIDSIPDSQSTFGIDGLEEIEQVEDEGEKRAAPSGLDLNAELLAAAGTSVEEANEMVEGLRRAFWEHQKITVAKNDPLCAQALWMWLTFEATSKRFEARLEESTSLAIARINAATAQLIEAQNSLHNAFSKAVAEFDEITLNRTDDFKKATVVFADVLNKSSQRISDQLIGATQRISAELVSTAEDSMAKMRNSDNQRNSDNLSSESSPISLRKNKSLIQRAAERLRSI